jgi:hypothetical protein
VLIRAGSTVRFVREGVEQEARVVSIEACPRRGDKFGIPVPQLRWEDRENAYLMLDGGGSCFGFELVNELEMVEDVCTVCGAHIGFGIRALHLGLCDDHQVPQ